VASEAGSSDARSVGTTVVRGNDLDVFMTLASIELVLDPKIGKVHSLIEVRKLVFMRPALDFTRVAIGPAVTVRPATISFLKPLLVLALELLLEDDASDVGTFVAQTRLLAQVCGIELRVMRQLARAADASVEGLLAGIVAIVAM
jgi:hypothetical protein